MEKFNDRFYPETLKLDKPVLKNKLNIKNSSELELVELEMSINKLFRINSSTVPGNFNFYHLQNYHKYIFGALYEWAGTIRKFGVEKYEEVLSGGSVDYEEPLMIVPIVRNALNEFNNTDFNSKSIDEKTNIFCDTLATVWKAHPFNEGNTRTITKFMCDAAKANNLEMESRLFTENNSYFRKALVVYTLGVKNHLQMIVKDAIQRGDSMKLGQNDLGILVNSFVKGKIEKDQLVNRQFEYNNQKFEITDIQKTPGKAQADAIIKDCVTQNHFLEHNFAGSRPFKMNLGVNVPQSHFEAVKTKKMTM